MKCTGNVLATELGESRVEEGEEVGRVDDDAAANGANRVVVANRLSTSVY